MNVERLGIFGGTFDPPHLGHFRAAESVREAMALDRILFVPAAVPPHKSGPGITPAEDRYRMVRAAVEKEPFFEVSRIELDRNGPSFTIDTLGRIESEMPGSKVFFITGIDSFRDIRTWHRWEELLKSYSLVVHGRPGSALSTAYEAVPEKWHSSFIALPESGMGSEARVDVSGTVFLLHAVTLNISSTEVRSMIRAGRSIRYLVPTEVEEFIDKRRLYRK
jgi:nicotinate-nucleotide adenylyltransferase